MAEARAAESEDRAQSARRRFVERLADARWLVIGLAAVFLLLFAAEALTWAGALIAFAATTLLVGLIPLAVAGRPIGVAETLPIIWPETGIKLFAEALPNPCFVLDRRGIVRFANHHALAAFSIRPGEPLGFRLRVPELVAAFDRVAKGGPPERVEFSERVPTERWFAAWFAGLDQKSAGDFVVLMLEDLSERRRADRIRVDFVANASHELRTPLASLAGFIETLQGSAREDPAARERFLSIMHDQATRMSRLIDDLLSLSRIELKVHVRPSDPVDLVPVIRHLTDALEPLARELGVAIDALLPADPVMVTGDRDELIQVFENLIENAIKYGHSGKRVVVAVKPAGDTTGAAVSVRDFGPGIAEEHLPRLTERFYRVDVESSREHRGTGLGLAIAKHILARHGARLTIESTLGEGAFFEVTFPQAAFDSGSEIGKVIDINQ
jgi:two-component system, OmpR family, phosphate regulon sensor histidine kinase PhoR